MAVDRVGNKLNEDDLVVFFIEKPMMILCHVKKVDSGGTLVAMGRDPKTNRPQSAGMMPGILHLELDWQHTFDPENPIIPEVYKVHVDPNNASLIETEKARKAKKPN